MADDKKQKTLFLDDSGAAPPRRGDDSSPLSSQSTMMIDPAQAPPAQRPVVVPTMMKQPPQQPLPPMQRPRRASAWGRWIGGPILAAVVAAGTFAGANALLPRKKVAVGNGKPQGKLRVNTQPPGASILVDGKRFPRFTPALIEGDVGATLKLTFNMEGFEPKEAEVYVADGEHPFNVHLSPVAGVAVAPAPSPVEPATTKKEHHGNAPKLKEPVGEATISILVRPWAIVFVDKQRLRQTPIQGYKISSGKHVIELANEGKDRREKIEVNLKPGEEQEIRRDWDK